MCRTHRYDHISLLHFCPGEVLQELVARHAAKVASRAEHLNGYRTYFSTKKSNSLLRALGAKKAVALSGSIQA